MRAMRKVSKVWSAVRFVVVAAVLFVGLVAPAQARAASHAEQVLALVNVERKKVGLKPLALSQRCQAQADKRAKEICQRGRFNHKGAFNGLRGYGWMGENIAKGATPITGGMPGGAGGSPRTAYSTAKMECSPSVTSPHWESRLAGGGCGKGNFP